MQIPTVRDRIVARAILQVLTPIIDPELGHASFGYRPGLGVVDAVQRLARLRDEGLTWVLRTDVDDCFPSVPVDRVRRLLAALVGDADLLRVVDHLLSRDVVTRSRGRRPLRGLAQGCPMSPILANLLLVLLDDDLLDEGFALVRYADDIAVAAATQDDAWQAWRCAAESLRRMHMHLGDEDTAVTTFEDGFTFLGEDFGPRYPPALDEVRVEEPRTQDSVRRRSGRAGAHRGRTGRGGVQGRRHGPGRALQPRQPGGVLRLGGGQCGHQVMGAEQRRGPGLRLPPGQLPWVLRVRCRDGPPAAAEGADRGSGQRAVRRRRPRDHRGEDPQADRGPATVRAAARTSTRSPTR